VTQPDFDSLLRRVWETEDDEISCTECFDLVPQYVDLEVAGEPADKKVPRLRQHLNQCGVCREEYETLRDLVRLEAEGRLPSSDEPRNSS
jgi:predicted anti-sigma-YlaC factor YlaD